ncbi:MAG: DUF3560 domain-containing protein [Thermomicrobiales bacterium]
MTYRERRQRRVEQLEIWADKREAKAEQAATRAAEIVAPIPFGQPILVGHHSEAMHRRALDRHDSAMRQSFEHQEKAERMQEKAANVAAQLNRAIYDDDPDAVEQLTARIASLEAERDRIKAYNASCRKGTRDLSLLDDHQRADLASLARVAAFQIGPQGQFPGYVLSNLGGNINRNKKRLAELQRA